MGGGRKGRIHLLSIIGEIEGHENLSGSTKTTKYEHILPELAKVEDDPDIDGILMLINTVGGDVSCGLALAEMLASLSIIWMNGKTQKQSSQNRKRKKNDRHVVLSMRNCRFIKKKASGKARMAGKIEKGTSVWNKKTGKMA